MSTPTNFNGQIPVIDPANVAMLLIDHQSGLFQTIMKDEGQDLIASLGSPEARKALTSFAKRCQPDFLQFGRSRCPTLKTGDAHITFPESLSNPKLAHTDKKNARKAAHQITY